MFSDQSIYTESIKDLKRLEHGERVVDLVPVTPMTTLRIRGIANLRI